MFPQRQRIPGAELKSFPRATARRSPYFSVSVRPNRLPYPRFAIVVGSKAHKKAVTRHLLKRRLSEYLHKAHLSGDIVVTVLSPAAALSAAKLRQEIKLFF